MSRSVQGWNFWLLSDVGEMMHIRNVTILKISGSLLTFCGLYSKQGMERSYMIKLDLSERFTSIKMFSCVVERGYLRQGKIKLKQWWTSNQHQKMQNDVISWMEASPTTEDSLTAGVWPVSVPHYIGHFSALMSLGPQLEPAKQPWLYPWMRECGSGNF